eukprot:10029403-Ditylum_brightwellii.AAC.1
MSIILCKTDGPNNVSGARNNCSSTNQGTQNTADVIEHLLDCCASYLDVVIQYCPSDMVLRVHSDASYLSEPKVRSRAGGYFYLGNHHPQHMNGPVLVLLQILCNVMASSVCA